MSAQEFADDLLSLAGEYVNGGGVRVFVKTNYGPEFEVGSSGVVDSRAGGKNSSAGGSSGLLGLLGVRAGVIVRDRSGRRLSSFGDYPETQAWRLALLVGVVALLGVVVVRGLVK